MDNIKGDFLGIIGQHPCVSNSNLLHVDMFWYFFIIWGIDAFKVMGNFPDVLSFNRLFLKVNWFICKYMSALPLRGEHSYSNQKVLKGCWDDNTLLFCFLIVALYKLWLLSHWDHFQSALLPLPTEESRFPIFPKLLPSLPWGWALPYTTQIQVFNPSSNTFILLIDKHSDPSPKFLPRNCCWWLRSGTFALWLIPITSNGESSFTVTARSTSKSGAKMSWTPCGRGFGTPTTWRKPSSPSHPPMTFEATRILFLVDLCTIEDGHTCSKGRHAYMGTTSSYCLHCGARGSRLSS